MSERQDDPAECRPLGWAPEHRSAAAGSGGQLMIDALRRLAFSGSCAAIPRRDFALAFPGDAGEVFATFRAFLGVLAHGGRRKLRVGAPGARSRTPDETLVVALVAAAQAGDEALVDAYLCWLTHVEARGAAAITVRALATALAVQGQWLQPLPRQFALAPLAGLCTKI